MNNIYDNYYIGKLSDNHYLLVGLLNGYVHRMFVTSKDVVPTNKREFKTYLYSEYKQALNALYHSPKCDTGKSYYECFGMADIENMKADKVLARINAA